MDLMKAAGATIINNTEIPNYERIINPDGWDWDYGTKRGFPNESEYTHIKVDFYHNIQEYLVEVTNTKMRTLENLVQYNYDNDGSMGGNPWPLGVPGWYSGQDSFLNSLATKGDRNELYWQAVNFTQQSSRGGIDTALTRPDRSKLSGLLVPPDPGQAYLMAGQAGYPMITIPAGIHSSTGMPFGLAIMQTAFGEGELVKWASAIEDLVREKQGPRVTPSYKEHLRKNVPVYYPWRYEGAPRYDTD